MHFNERVSTLRRLHRRALYLLYKIAGNSQFHDHQRLKNMAQSHQYVKLTSDLDYHCYGGYNTMVHVSDENISDRLLRIPLKPTCIVQEVTDLFCWLTDKLEKEYLEANDESTKAFQILKKAINMVTGREDREIFYEYSFGKNYRMKYDMETDSGSFGIEDAYKVLKKYHQLYFNMNLFDSEEYKDLFKSGEKWPYLRSKSTNEHFMEGVVQDCRHFRKLRAAELDKTFESLVKKVMDDGLVVDFYKAVSDWNTSITFDDLKVGTYEEFLNKLFHTTYFNDLALRYDENEANKIALYCLGIGGHKINYHEGSTDDYVITQKPLWPAIRNSVMLAFISHCASVLCTIDTELSCNIYYGSADNNLLSVIKNKSVRNHYDLDRPNLFETDIWAESARASLNWFNDSKDLVVYALEDLIGDNLRTFAIAPNTSKEKAFVTYSLSVIGAAKKAFLNQHGYQNCVFDYLEHKVKLNRWPKVKGVDHLPWHFIISLAHSPAINEMKSRIHVLEGVDGYDEVNKFYESIMFLVPNYNDLYNQSK